MFIYEGNRDWVESSLRSSTANAAVARAIARVGAKLDGTDSLMALCAVDDLLLEEFGTEGSPLKPPAGMTDLRRPSLSGAIIGLHARATRARRRARETGAPRPPVIDLDAAKAELREKYEIEKRRFESTPRFHDADRTKVEKPPHSVDASSLRMRVSRVREDRAKYAVFAESVDALRRAVQGLNAIGPRVQSAFSALGCSEDQFFLEVDADELDELVRRSDGVELDGEAVQAQRWLLEQLSAAVGSPTRLAFRSEAASQMCGRPAPYRQHGPSSLLEATETWLRRWEPQDPENLKQEAKELVEKAADQVIAQLSVGMSWLDELAPASVRHRASMLRTSLGEDLFKGSVSFEDGAPAYPILKGLLLEGAYRSDWQSPFPKRRKRKILSRQQVMKLKKAIKRKVPKLTVRKLKKPKK